MALLLAEIGAAQAERECLSQHADRPQRTSTRPVQPGIVLTSRACAGAPEGGGRGVWRVRHGGGPVGQVGREWGTKFLTFDFSTRRGRRLRMVPKGGDGFYGMNGRESSSVDLGSEKNTGGLCCSLLGPITRPPGGGKWMCT